MFDVKSAEYRAVARKINVELEALFVKNQQYFAQNNKSIHNSCVNYRPKRLGLRLDPKGYVNLMNLNTMQPVYDCDPTEYAEQQVEIFFRDRPHFTMMMKGAGAYREDYPYTKCLHRLDELYASVQPDVFATKQNQSDSFYMFGGGLYLQLQFLLNKLDVKRLTVFETDFDSFYASMHVIDWSEIYRYFERDGYNLDIFFVKSDQTSYHKVGENILSAGLHNFAKIDYMQHYQNSELDFVSGNIRSYCKALIGGLGFFEDERIGLAHTLVNLKNKMPLFISNNNVAVNECPVMLVGNGPSLDELLPYIKKNASKYVIVSCGSSIGALMKHGIQPDIHVEQERMLVTKKSLLKGTTEKFRHNIRFIGLSPCHPDIFGLFKHQHMVLKSADLAGDMLKKNGFENIHEVRYCNPLVSNFGLSISIDLGFQNIYLAGVDCGMVDLLHHHSKSSNIYYDNEGESDLVYSGGVTVPGNFRDKVFTTDMFKTSRISLETKIAASDVNVKVFNLSDGALINGATSLKVDSIPDMEDIVEKDVMLDKRFKLYFDPDIAATLRLDESTESFKKEFLMFLKAIRKLFIIRDLTEAEMRSNFNAIEAILKAYFLSDRTIYRLFHGSIRGLMLNMISSKKVLEASVFLEYISQAEKIINDFFSEVEFNVSQEFTKYDH